MHIFRDYSKVNRLRKIRGPIKHDVASGPDGSSTFPQPSPDDKMIAPPESPLSEITAPMIRGRTNRTNITSIRPPAG